MKKKNLIAVMALLCLSATSFAQTEKGNYLIGGSVGFSNDNFGSVSQINTNSSNNENTTKTNSILVLPRVDYFFSKNLAIGLSVSYQNYKSTDEYSFNSETTTVLSSNTTKSHSFGVGPFVRYYTDLAEKFKFFGQLGTDFSFGKQSQEGTNPNSQNPQNFSHYKTSNFSGAISPGFAFFPAKKWAVAFSLPLLSYNNQKLENDGANPVSYTTKSDGFYFGLSSINPNIGFNYHF